MLAYTYKEHGKFELTEKPVPEIIDGCDCNEILSLIEQGKIDTTPLITHRFSLKDIEKAYEIFENKLDGVIKIAIKNT